MDHTALLHGLYVPLVTPFTEAGEVDSGALAELARSALAEGAAGLVALGTTGESAALTPAEQRLVVDVCAEACSGRDTTLIVGSGSNDTGRTVRSLLELDADTAVDAALVPVPYFTRPTEAGVLAHFAEVAAHSPVPLVVYDIPYRTGRTLSADTLRALAAVPGVAGVKHAAGCIDGETIRLLGDGRDGFSVLGGDDPFASAMLALGADGVILGSANVDTRTYAALVSAWRAGDVDRARSLGHRLADLSAALFAEPNPSVIKGVLHAQGRIPNPDVRLPLLPAEDESVALACSRLVGDVDRAHAA